MRLRCRKPYSPSKAHQLHGYGTPPSAKGTWHSPSLPRGHDGIEQPHAFPRISRELPADSKVPYI